MLVFGKTIAEFALIIGLSYFLWWRVLTLSFNVFSYNRPVTNEMIFLAMIVSFIISDYFQQGKQQ